MAIFLLVGCLLSGLMIARGLIMRDMTRDEAEASEPGNHRLTAVWLLVVVVCGLLVLAGCGSFWEDQGAASRTSAQAQLRRAEAERQNAQAAIIDAEARGALAASQAEALRTTIDANSDLMRQAVDLADDGEYVWLFAGLAFGVLAFAGWAIWATQRRPAAASMAPAGPRQIATIETVQGQQWTLEQREGETHAAFLLRVQVLAAQAAARERLLLEGPRERR